MRARPEVEPTEGCSVCAAGGLASAASVCWDVAGGCIVVATEHQHLCLQHAVTCEPIGEGAAEGPCVDGVRWLGVVP